MAKEWKPEEIHTMDGFIAQLRALKLRAENPSITEITRRVHRDWHQAGRPRSEWPARSTVGNCFQLGRRRPNADLLLAVVRALVEGDESLVREWSKALYAALGENDPPVGFHVSERIPPPAEGMVERLSLVAEAQARLNSATGGRTLVLEGAAGVGKSSLALEIGRSALAADRMRRPVFIVSLGGSGSGSTQARPLTVLAHLLRLLGTPESEVPASLGARSALHSRLLTEAEALLILDDADSWKQIRPLLPGPGAARAIVTTHRPLAVGADELDRLSVPPCEPFESLEILRRIAGADRIDQDPYSAMRIAESIGHIPQAVAIIGRHMRSHPEWSPADYHEQVLVSLVLRGGMGEAFMASEGRVPQGARRLLRFLSLQDSSFSDVPTAAALTGTTPATARLHLRALAHEGLLQSITPDLYHLGRLVRGYAGTRLRIDEPVSQVREAVHRLTQHHATRTGKHPGRTQPG
ncbi:NB-ARC domain-containing protein [Streptomyces tubercidicus]|uniref:NB-ARC domain-containing protein n=1 Tax=Streptomyces tubercidicus TaxID=47759 RepID=UPI003465C942